jgi:predicted unusual protein kinase regulating ubiquinone biosynthesis (AarF/ABC1/UbiB family)
MFCAAAVQPLAAGSFGAVYKGTWGGQKYAVKMQHPRTADDDEEEFKSYVKEFRLLQAINHPNVVRVS